MPQLNTPTFVNNNKLLAKPSRPSSLNVPSNLKPSEALARKNVTDIAGVNVCTPSNGMFNFESLMEGGKLIRKLRSVLKKIAIHSTPLELLKLIKIPFSGTGLTPIQSNPLVPCSTQNRNPLEMLNTPTSGNEPSKLVSL